MALRSLRHLALLLLLAAALAPSPAASQIDLPQGLRPGFQRNPPYRFGLQGNRADFSFCRLAYNEVTSERGGQGWETDYPLADENFMFRMEELTTIVMSKYPDGEFAYSIMELSDPDLYRCGFLFASDVGTMGLNTADTERLRDWLLKGGFLWVDDFWGDQAWQRWSREILRVLPGKTIVDLTPEHPIFSLMYRVREVPQIPSIQQWQRMGGGTSERGAESAIPDIRAIFDERGRMMVLMSHDTDIADGWEREANEEFFDLFSPNAYAIAANVIVWAMTH